MSGYNSDLLFNTPVYGDDGDNTFVNEPISEPTNPFNQPVQRETTVVQQKINPPSPHNSVSYQQSPLNGSSNGTSTSYPNANQNNNSVYINRESLKTTPVNPTGNISSSSNTLNNSNSSASNRKSIKAPTMDIEVKDPEFIGDGVSAYVVYKVSTKASHPDQPDYKKESTVTRRYSDFLWLRNVLKDTRRGTIIPPIPEKSIVKSNKEFLEGRRRELEKFLNRIVENEALVHSNELKIFLEAKDEQLNEAKRARPDVSMESSVTSPPIREEKTLNKITSLFGSGLNTITNLAQSVKEVDGWFGDKKIYVVELDSRLRKLEESISVIIKKRRELASAISEFCSAGLSFSSREADHIPDIAHGFQKLTEVEGSVKRGMEDLCNNETGYFEEGIRDYIKVLGSVKELLNDRLDALFYMQNQERTLASKKEKFEKAKFSASSKAAMLNREVEEQTRKLADAKSEYDRITASARIELEKFDEKRASEMKRILNFVIRLNLDHFLKASDCWKEFLTEQHQNGDPNVEVHNKASWGSTTI